MDDEPTGCRQCGRAIKAKGSNPNPIGQLDYYCVDGHSFMWPPLHDWDITGPAITCKRCGVIRGQEGSTLCP